MNIFYGGADIFKAYCKGRDKKEILALLSGQPYLKKEMAKKSKSEIVKLLTKHCEHRQMYINHPNCLIKDGGFQEKVGYFDIESTGLKANFALVLSYAIKDSTSSKIYGRVITKEELYSDNLDKQLLTEMCADLRKFDRIITHYGGDYKFDIPFIRTRCVHYGVDFPVHIEIYHTDTHNILKQKFKLSSNRLATACQFFEIAAKHHPLDGKVWIRSVQGKPSCLKYIWVHNVEDVMSTEALYKKIAGFVQESRKSI